MVSSSSVLQVIDATPVGRRGARSHFDVGQDGGRRCQPTSPIPAQLLSKSAKIEKI
jgi:hypothetical protein